MPLTALRELTLPTQKALRAVTRKHFCSVLTIPVRSVVCGCECEVWWMVVVEAMVCPIVRAE